MGRYKKKTDRKSCLLLLVLVLGGFYFLMRLLFMASTPGTVTSVGTSYSSRARDRHDLRRVDYTYSVRKKTYHGTVTVGKKYRVNTGTPVTVRYWRFKHSSSTLSEWSLPKYEQYTFRADLYRWALEYFILPALAMVIAAVFGLPMRRGNRK